MYQAVVLGQADACVEDKPIMADNIKTGGLDLTIVESTALWLCYHEQGQSGASGYVQQGTAGD